MAAEWKKRKSEWAAKNPELDKKLHSFYAGNLPEIDYKCSSTKGGISNQGCFRRHAQPLRNKD